MSVGESTLSGAGTGAAIGSAILPGVGTAIGATLGAGAGALAGWYDNKYNSAASQRKRMEEAGISHTRFARFVSLSTVYFKLHTVHLY